MHPASPFVRGWVALAAIGFFFGRDTFERLLQGGPLVDEQFAGRAPWLLLGGGAVLLLTVLGYILTWYFTRYQVAEGYVRVNTGFLFRQQRQARLDRVQAIDIVQPLLARIFGLAELKFEVADAGESAVRLAYLRMDEARQLRATILARAAGAAHGPDSPEAARRRPEHAGADRAAVAPGRVAAAERAERRRACCGGVASVVLSALTENRAFYLYLIPAALGLVAAYWAMFNKGYNFTAAISPDGIRLRYGLLDTQAQTLPPGRIQALRVSQPPLWRIFGWYRMQVNVAGYGAAGSNGEGVGPHHAAARRNASPTCWPCSPWSCPTPGPRTLTASSPRACAGWRTRRRRAGTGGPDSDGGFVTTPRRARLLAPLGWRRNGFAATDTALLIRSGRWWRHLVVVPHQRTQSMALQQGPLARRFRVADLVLHTTAGPVSPRLDPGRPGRRPGPVRGAVRPRPGRPETADQRTLAGAGSSGLADPRTRSPRTARSPRPPPTGRPAAWLSQDASASESSAPARSAPSWARRCARAEHAVIGVSAVSDASRERAETLLPGVPVLEVQDIVERAELVLLAVPDDALGPLVEGLAKLGAWQPGQLVAHTSGRFGVGILHPVRAAGAVPLALHPAMTFTGMSLDLTRLLDCTFGVTADAAMLPIAQALVVEMGAEPVAIAEADRVLYHAALAHGSNHLVTLVAQASQLLREVGVDAPERMLGPLLRATLENALASGESALTGPVARGDVGTVAAHAEALREHDGGAGGDILEAYLAMARATARRAGRRGLLGPEQLDGIRQALDGQARTA